jgi:beta-lactamase class A
MSDDPGLVRAVESLRAEVSRFVNAGDQPGGRSVLVRSLDVPRLAASAAAGEVRPGGSLLKLVSAVALYAAAARGEVDLDAPVTVGSLGRTSYPSVLQALDPGRVLSVREVCAFSLITSDNPAAQYIREVVGQDRLDGAIDGLGLVGTRFPVGFTDAELGVAGRGNVTTAADMATMIEHIETAPTLGDLRRFLVNNQRNNRIPVRLDDEIPVLHKTGSLFGVVNDVAVVHHPAGRVVLAFMCDGEKDTVLAAVAVGDAAERMVAIVTGAHPASPPGRG